MQIGHDEFGDGGNTVEGEAVDEQHTHDRGALFLARKRAQQNDGHRRKKGDPDGGEMPKFQRLEARPHDQNDTDDTRQNRRPAPWTDILLQHDGGKHGHKKRRQEDQRIGFRQRNGGEGIDAENTREKAGDGAPVHGEGPAHAPEFTPPFLTRLAEEDEDAGKQNAEEADFENADLRSKRLDGGIAHGKGRISEQTEQKTLLHLNVPKHRPQRKASPGRVERDPDAPFKGQTVWQI
ncbi:hypothetical protein AGR7A_Lc100032 [Agrobacterium deltaense NCPPB 1641]|uniref:Uncharacterized protein n=1 Tax=Agrobacterium deltaense NCPPB 1641 TaxID=1183425 RepID=A0A1S7TTU5_9HYPH|nr:hypothetical protein AGR7A_Lc100032 [Agrobacterium deltaense NCPPB 1641]